MTRDELIARIEAGETGPELLCAIAREARWRFSDGAEHILGNLISDSLGVVGYLEIPPWLASLDAAVSLVGDRWWEAYHDGFAIVWTEDGDNAKAANVSNNPAAALVAAWLKATA